MDLLVVTANSQEYVIPIYYEKIRKDENSSGFPVFDKIKPMKVYKTGDFINLIKEDLSNTKPQIEILMDCQQKTRQIS